MLIIEIVTSVTERYRNLRYQVVTKYRNSIYI